MTSRAVHDLTGPVFALVNPGSGNADPDRHVELLEACAAEAGVELRVLRAGSGKRKKVRRAIRDGAKTIIAVGGDGTVSKAGSEAAKHDVPLGIVPAGTGNLIANELCVTPDIETAIRDLFAPHRHTRVDAMKLGGDLFFSHISVGLYANIAEDPDDDAKRRFGKGYYVWRALHEVRKDRTWPFSLQLDERTLERETPMLLLANVKALGLASWDWGEHITPGDGCIDVCVVDVHGLADAARLAFDAAVDSTEQSPVLEHLGARRVIRIQCDEALPVRGDGNVQGELPIEVEVLPGALTVICPVHD